MFTVWSKYQLAVAGVGILAAGLLMVTYPSRYTIALVACFLIGHRDGDPRSAWGCCR